MSKVELVITIDDKLYNRIKYLEPRANTMLDELMRSVQNGTQLPEGHGELIDVNDIRVIKLEDGLHVIEHKKGDGVDVYIEAPTVIKADANADANKNSNATANKKIVWEPVERKEA